MERTARELVADVGMPQPSLFGQLDWDYDQPNERLSPWPCSRGPHSILHSDRGCELRNDPAETPQQLREKLATAFNDVADDYEAGRGTYPSALLLSLIGNGARSGDPGSVLEVGAGTGQATGALREHFGSVSALEPAPRLFRLLERRYEHDDRVSTFMVRFEEWPEVQRFDCVFSASAFHWVDPSVGFRKAYNLLHADGRFAVATYVQLKGYPEWDEPASQICELYEKFVAGKPLRLGTRNLKQVEEGLLERRGSIARALEWAEFDRESQDGNVGAEDLFRPADVAVDLLHVEYGPGELVRALASYGAFRRYPADARTRFEDALRDYMVGECDGMVTRPFAFVRLAASPKARNR